MKSSSLVRVLALVLAVVSVVSLNIWASGERAAARAEKKAALEEVAEFVVSNVEATKIVIGYREGGLLYRLVLSNHFDPKKLPYDIELQLPEGILPYAEQVRALQGEVKRLYSCEPVSLGGTNYRYVHRGGGTFLDPVLKRRDGVVYMTMTFASGRLEGNMIRALGSDLEDVPLKVSCQ